MNPKIRNISKWLLVCIACVAVGISVLYSLRNVIISPYLSRWICERVKTELGLTISIDRIEGNYINEIFIKSLATTDPGPYRPVAGINLQKLQVKYSLPALFGGFEKFLLKSRIEIERADIELDWNLPPGPSDKKEEAESPSAINLPSVNRIPNINVKESSVSIRTDQGSSEFVDVDLRVKNQGQGIALMDLNVKSWLWHADDITGGPVTIDLTCAYNQEMIEISSLKIDDDLLVLSGNIGLETLSESMPFTFSSLIAGDPLHLSGRIERDSLYTEFQAEELDLGVLSSIGPPDYTINGMVSFSGDIQVPLSSPQQVTGEMTLDIKDGNFKDLVVDTVHAALNADGRSIKIQRLDVNNGENLISINNAKLQDLLIAPNIDENIFKRISGAFNLDLKDVPSLTQLVGLNMGPMDSEIPQHRLQIKGLFKTGGKVLAQGELSVNENIVQLDPSEFILPPFNGDFSETVLNASLKTDFIELGSIEKIMPVPPLLHPMGGRLEGNITIKGSVASPNGKLDLKVKDLIVKDSRIGDLTAKLKGDGNHVLVENLEIINGNDFMKANGEFHIDKRMIDDGHLILEVTDIKEYQELWPENTYPMGGDIKGSIRMHGSLQKLEAQIDISSGNFRVGEVDISNTSIKATSTGNVLNVKNFETHAMGGLLRLSGDMEWNEQLKNFEAVLTECYLARKSVDLRLKEPTRISYKQPGIIELNDLNMEGSLGEVRLKGIMKPKGSYDISFELMNITGKEWLEEIIGEGIEAEGVNALGYLKGTYSSPEAGIRGSVQTLRSPYLPVPLAGEFKLLYDEDKLTIDKFQWSGEDESRVNVAGVLPIPYPKEAIETEERLSIEASVQLPDLRLLNMFLKNELFGGGAVSANLQMEGTWREPVADLFLETSSLNLNLDVPAFQPGPWDLKSSIRYKNGEISIQTLDLQSEILTFTGKGIWEKGPTPDTLYYSRDNLLLGEVTFDGQAEVPDLSWLASSFPELRRTGGRLDAEFSIRGEVQKPQVSAKLKVRDGTLRAQMELPSLEDIHVNAEITPEKIEISECKGSIGGATAHIKGKVIDILKEKPSVDMHLWGKNLLLYRRQGAQMRADTDLNLQGPLNEMDLSGDMAITEGRFNQYIDVLGRLKGNSIPDSGTGMKLFSIREPPLKDMKFDVKILSKKPVIIRSNLARGETRVDLHLSGTGEIPVLQGEVFVDNTRVLVPAGNIIIENGVVHFTQADPDRPVLNLMGTSRMLGYDITILVEGPYDEPIVTMSSSPPLSNEDLLLLVLTGTPPKKEGEDIDETARNLNIALYIGRDLINRWAADEDVEHAEAFLERFEIETGRDISNKGEETLEARFRLDENVLRDGDTLYLTGEKDVFNFYNAGLRIVFRFR